MGCHLYVEIAMCCAYFCIILMLIFVGVFTLKRRSTFHPFFSVLLSLFLITYAIDDSLELCGIIMDITGFGKGRPREVIGQIEVVFYVYISPRALLLLLERITATLYFAKYENFRPWRIFFVIELLTLGTATAWCYIFRGLDTFRQWIMLGFEIVIILALILLLLLNRSRVRQSIGTGVLASRYQTAENICAIRILLAIIEKSCEYHLPLILDFVGYMKAFDPLKTQAKCLRLFLARLSLNLGTILITTIRLFLLELRIRVNTYFPKVFTAVLPKVIVSPDWEDKIYLIDNKTISSIFSFGDIKQLRRDGGHYEQAKNSGDKHRPKNEDGKMKITVNPWCETRTLMTFGMYQQVDSYVYVGRELNMIIDLASEVILLDALVGLLNIGGELLLSVGTTYDDEACSTRLGTIVFITMQVCCDALEACIPISVMVLHPSLKKMFKYHKKGISDDHEPRNHLQNVIGMRINFDQLSAENHFEGLRKAWN